MAKKNEIIKVEAVEVPATEQIESLIVDLRGQQAMLDRDLAMLYGVETKVLNQAVKRNIERFPVHFRFQLTDRETNELVTNCDRFRNLKHSSVNPFAFTEQGVAMLSTVLHSETAVNMSIRIMDAFVAMRHFIGSHAQMFQRLEVMEQNQLAMSAHLSATDKRIDEVFKRLDDGTVKPKQGVFYDGEVFDAYKFIAEKIKEAKIRIVLFDNYIDESVLNMLDKRANSVVATIYTKAIDARLQTDIARHDAQYPHIDVQVFTKAHDRFLCIDDVVYLIGASLKDLGKKWCGFTRLEITTDDLLTRM